MVYRYIPLIHATKTAWNGIAHDISVSVGIMMIDPWIYGVMFKNRAMIRLYHCYSWLETVDESSDTNHGSLINHRLPVISPQFYHVWLHPSDSRSTGRFQGSKAKKRISSSPVKNKQNMFSITWVYPLVNIQKAIENDYLQWIYPSKMVIFHSYVKLPEGIYFVHRYICTKYTLCNTIPSSYHKNSPK